MSMKRVAISELKTRCLALLEDVARTGETLLVIKRGKPLARVVPEPTTTAASPQDTLYGTVEILGDVVSPIVPGATRHARIGTLLWQERVQKKRKAKLRR
jgi:antitoxin (DNA-binding transcriptional repressor) of toxin-antitoxin stability system